MRSRRAVVTAVLSVGLATVASCASQSASTESSSATTVPESSSSDAAPPASVAPPAVAPPTLVRLEEDGIAVLGDDGRVVRTISAPGASDELGAPFALAGFLVAQRSDDDGEVAFFDLAAGEVASISLAPDLFPSPFGDATFVGANDEGGPLFIVDLRSRSVLDVGVMLGRTEPRFIDEVGDLDAAQETFDDLSGGGGTAVLPVDDPADGWFVEGRILDVRDDRALVVAVDADGAVRLEVSTRGEPTGRGIDLAPGPFAAARLRADGRVTHVSEAGEISILDLETGESEDAGALGFDPESVARAGPDQMMAVGSSTSVLLDLDGRPLREWPAGDEAITVWRFGVGCAVVQPGPRLRADGGGVEVIDLADGRVVAELESTPVLVEGDGCTAIATPGVLDDSEVVIDGERVDVGGGRVVAIAPMLNRVVVERNRGTGFVLVDLVSGDEVELPDGHYYLI